MNLWREAKRDGYTDIVFVWIVQAEEGAGEATLFAKYMPREAAYALAKDQDIPEYTKNQLSRPAGPERAWMLLMTPTGTASLRVTCASLTPGGDA